MKRSQAISIVQKNLYHRINGCTVCPEWLADSILSDLEETGMLPPPITIKDPGQFPGDEFSYISTEWEQE